jgi:hypothetical protein
VTIKAVNQDPVLRDCRRHQLALRLMVHQARTQTIAALTNLSRHQLAALRQRCSIPERMRQRGPSPRSLERFTHSQRARGEGATLAAFCHAYRVLPMRTAAHDSRRRWMTLEFGERLCATYEAYRACFPRSDIAIEELLSLVIGLSDGRDVGLSSCASCGCTMLIDHLTSNRGTCLQCQLALHAGRDSDAEAACGDAPGSR